jgi:hypothetical protein
MKLFTDSSEQEMMHLRRRRQKPKELLALCPRCGVEQDRTYQKEEEADNTLREELCAHAAVFPQSLPPVIQFPIRRLLKRAKDSVDALA